MKLLLISIGSLVTIAIGAFVALEFWTLRLPKLDAASKASTEKKIDALSRWLDALDQQQKFNGTVLIAQKGELLFQRNIGAADVQGRAISDTTSFNLASLSKHITAFAILLLEHEGKLSRRDPLTRYIPELASYKSVTLDHLLMHLSGIPDYALDRELSKKLKQENKVFTPKDLIAWLGEPGQSLKSQPGQQEDYSNSNYVLLAEVIARVSGQSYAGFMQSRIFDPLGMADTAVVNRLEHTEKLKDRAYGFRKRFFYFGSSVSQDLNHFDGVSGDGNIYASARDLVIWDKGLREGTLLPVNVYEQAYHGGRLINGEMAVENIFGEIIVPGLGWNVQDYPIVTAYGSWQGFSNFYWRDLENDTVLVVLSNSGFFLRTAAIGEQLAEFAKTLGADQ